MGEAVNKVSRTYLLTPESVSLLEKMALTDNRSRSSEVEWLIKAEHKRRNADPLPAPARGDGQEGGDD
jgi:hypothetical protein